MKSTGASSGVTYKEGIKLLDLGSSDSEQELNLTSLLGNNNKPLAKRKPHKSKQIRSQGNCTCKNVMIFLLIIILLATVCISIFSLYSLSAKFETLKLRFEKELSSKVKDKNSEINELTDKFVNLQSDFTKAQSANEKHEKLISDLNKKFSAISMELTDLKGQVNSPSEQQVTQNTALLTDLSKSVLNFQDQINSVNIQIEKLKQNSSLLQNQTKRLSSQIDDLQLQHSLISSHSTVTPTPKPPSPSTLLDLPSTYKIVHSIVNTTIIAERLHQDVKIGEDLKLLSDKFAEFVNQTQDNFQMFNLTLDAAYKNLTAQLNTYLKSPINPTSIPVVTPPTSKLKQEESVSTTPAQPATKPQSVSPTPPPQPPPTPPHLSTSSIKNTKIVPTTKSLMENTYSESSFSKDHTSSSVESLTDLG